MTHFPDPSPPHPRGNLLKYMHSHEWVEVGAEVSPNGVWFSLWSCKLCPDIGVGQRVGPVPPGYCDCGWVQKKWPRKRCEDCKRPMEDG